MSTKQDKTKDSTASEPKAKSENLSSEANENDIIEIPSSKTGVRINPS